ncbi:MAG: hypothetical protein KAI43_07880 [Candidatus Aureabacteria bacterium]|nr:hypothetical protein [Candidatus Auribacterota bacterium]
MDINKLNISITDPIDRAFSKTKKILFVPFDYIKWLLIGFSAWLANLGFGGNAHGNIKHRSRESYLQLIEQMTLSEKRILLLVLIGIMLFAAVIAFTILWLRCRGVFMFTDCIVKNKGHVKFPWKEYKKEGNSFFRVLAPMWFVGIILIISILLLFLNIYRNGSLINILVFLLTLFIFIIWSFFYISMKDIVATIMYIKRISFKEAFNVFFSVFRQYPSELLLYALFKLILIFVSSAIIVMATCFTCSIAVLPYIGTVILLPVFVFLRSYSLCFLSQFGDDFDVWKEH